jgi:hypothetical protein
MVPERPPRRIRPAGALRTLALAGLAAVLALAAPAADYHVAAQGGGGGDGSAGAPWPSVAAALASGRLAGGDRLLLAAGEYGRLVIQGQDFDPPLTIASAPGGRAHVESIQVQGSRGLTLEGLDVWPLTPTNVPNQRPGQPLVQTSPNSSQLVFAGLDIRGRQDALTTYFNWSQQDWVSTWRAGGVMLRGPDQTLRDSVLSGVGNAIQTLGDRAQVLDNEVRGFSRDALRAFGEGTVFRGNRVQDCFKVDGSHRDGFQSWADRKGQGIRPVVSGITLIDNVIIEWAGPPGHPLRCTMQGISLFNGPYRNWIISNNLVAVSAFHGIALFGGQSSEIVNNTVVQIDGTPGIAPWIALKGNVKNNIVANNAAMKFHLPPGAALERNNFVIGSPQQIFMSVPQRDFRPKPGSPLVGRADPSFGDKHDLAGRPRPGRPAIGALEPP